MRRAEGRVHVMRQVQCDAESNAALAMCPLAASAVHPIPHPGARSSLFPGSPLRRSGLSSPLEPASGRRLNMAEPAQFEAARAFLAPLAGCSELVEFIGLLQSELLGPSGSQLPLPASACCTADSCSADGRAKAAAMPGEQR